MHMQSTDAYFEKVERVHECMFLVLCQSRIRFRRLGELLTAIPAKAPAAIFSARVKFGGSPSYSYSSTATGA